MPDFIQAADWAVLHWIRENLHCGALDFLMPKLTLLGEGGAVWIVAGLALTASKKYRKHGICLLLALLALDLLAVVGMRTSGRNTIRAGSPFGRLPVLLVPAVLALLAVAACALLLAARGELIPIFQAVGSLLEGALIAVFRFLTSLFQGRSAGSAGMSSAAGGTQPVSVSTPTALPPQSKR